jgi:hypothetical protein
MTPSPRVPPTPPHQPAATQRTKRNQSRSAGTKRGPTTTMTTRLQCAREERAGSRRGRGKEAGEPYRSRRGVMREAAAGGGRGRRLGFSSPNPFFSLRLRPGLSRRRRLKREEKKEKGKRRRRGEARARAARGGGGRLGVGPGRAEGETHRGRQIHRRAEKVGTSFCLHFVLFSSRDLRWKKMLGVECSVIRGNRNTE